MIENQGFGPAVNIRYADYAQDKQVTRWMAPLAKNAEYRLPREATLEWQETGFWIEYESLSGKRYRTNVEWPDGGMTDRVSSAHLNHSRRRPMTGENELLASRISRLEQENRRLRLIVLGIALALTAVLLMAAGPKPRTIEAEKIVILDSHGRARVTIGTPELAGAAIFTKPDEPVIWLSDEKGTDRATLAADGLRLNDDHAKPLVELRSDAKAGGSQLRLYSSDGKISWSAP